MPQTQALQGLQAAGAVISIEMKEFLSLTVH
jgi:hypothetical protein